MGAPLHAGVGVEASNVGVLVRVGKTPGSSVFCTASVGESVTSVAEVSSVGDEVTVSVGSPEKPGMLQAANSKHRKSSVRGRVMILMVLLYVIIARRT